MKKKFLELKEPQIWSVTREVKFGTSWKKFKMKLTNCPSSSKEKTKS